jgi:hypothetical protein
LSAALVAGSSRTGKMSMEAEITRNVLMYFVLPLWLAAGFADWLCHRASSIATTAGPKESLIHLLMLTEMGIAVTAAMTFEVNALILLVMIVCWALHEATAVWDVFYAVGHRVVTPIEQWVHSYLGVLPMLSLVMVVVLNWSQFLALFGMGTEPPRFDLALKEPGLPWGYVLSIIGAVMLLEVLPYIEELVRGLRANNGRLVPVKSATQGGDVPPARSDQSIVA